MQVLFSVVCGPKFMKFWGMYGTFRCYQCCFLIIYIVFSFDDDIRH